MDPHAMNPRQLTSCKSHESSQVPAVSAAMLAASNHSWTPSGIFAGRLQQPRKCCAAAEEEWRKMRPLVEDAACSKREVEMPISGG